jgi:wyosine [tRNA(Phe)-imidazoG37] synthetase (radical SAM superfamily)
MIKYQTIFGIVPSRRLGRSLGISPIPHKSCNYSCIYCQLGNTTHYVRERKNFYPLNQILDELKQYLQSITADDYDVVTIVGDGEPTLYKDLGSLIKNIKKFQSKPVAIISNGSLISNAEVFEALLEADIALLNFDSWDEASHKRINRPSKSITFQEKYQYYQKFAKEFTGILYLEVMMIKDLNDSKENLEKISKLAKLLHPHQIFVNSPVRPPAENWVKIVSDESITLANKLLNAVNISYLPESNFSPSSKSFLESILAIIGRHPLQKGDIMDIYQKFFHKNGQNLKKTGEITENDEVLLELFKQLDLNPNVEKIQYSNSVFYRRIK